jgi:hypothetical protein
MCFEPRALKYTEWENVCMDNIKMYTNPYTANVENMVSYE